MEGKEQTGTTESQFNFEDGRRMLFGNSVSTTQFHIPEDRNVKIHIAF